MQPRLHLLPQVQRLHPLAPLMKVLPSILGKLSPPSGLSRPHLHVTLEAKLAVLNSPSLAVLFNLS